jgi:alpha-L-rhamnosidase
MNRRRFVFTGLGGLTAARALGAGKTTAGAALRPVDLRCESQADPLGIDLRQPRLSWVLESSRRAQRQGAYRVLAASDPTLLAANRGDLWDSGKVDTDQSIHVAYAGKALTSRARCYWKVRVWDRIGKPSEWSAGAMWSMGLLEPGDWQARWISGPPGGSLPLLRTAFHVEKPVRRAELILCGLGFHEARINGQPIGDAVLEPGWTNYRKTCFYRVHDVTSRIGAGENVLGVMLGNGMYNVTGGRYTKFTGSFGPPKLIAQLHIEFADGTSTCVATGGSWSVAPGPITFSCIYGGEDYDARREWAGWDRPRFDASGWSAATVTEGPGGRLSSRSAPPIKVMQEFKTARVTQPRPGIYVYDLGQNFSGWPRLAVKGPAGAVVKLRPGELLDSDGLVSQRSSGGPMWFSYTLKGEGTETWHPRFSYYGFRYVQVEGAAPEGAAGVPSDLPRVIELLGQFVHSSAKRAGEIACSNPQIERIHSLITAAMRSNLQSVLTDCPHREKLGWLEVSHLLADSLTFNYDLAAFYTKICADMREAQLENGLVPDIAPEYTVLQRGFRDSPEWGSAYVIIPWVVWRTYGDRRLLEEHFEGMQRYVAYLGSQARDGIVSHGLGDWYDVGPKAPGVSQLTSKGLTATAVYYQDIEILRQAALLLDRADDARAYAKLAVEVRAAFNAQFLHAETNHYDRGSQTASAMPLRLGLVEEPRRPAVLESLVGNIRAGGNRVTAGDVGFSYLVRALTDAERGDVLYDMVCQPDGPGYLDQLKKGATALTEAWDANPRSSQNHCMLGHVDEWFFRGLGGIRNDPAGPGFSKIIIRPQLVGDLAWAKAVYNSVRGRIACSWKREGGKLTIDVTIPANAAATVYVPVEEGSSVTESGKPAAHAEGVRYLRKDGRAAVFEVESGAYHFATRAGRPRRS